MCGFAIDPCGENRYYYHQLRKRPRDVISIRGPVHVSKIWESANQQRERVRAYARGIHISSDALTLLRRRVAFPVPCRIVDAASFAVTRQRELLIFKGHISWVSWSEVPRLFRIVPPIVDRCTQRLISGYIRSYVRFGVVFPGNIAYLVLAS